ncbi:unnamed protein product, partial [Dovyalis caffra]
VMLLTIVKGKYSGDADVTLIYVRTSCLRLVLGKPRITLTLLAKRPSLVEDYE